VDARICPLPVIIDSPIVFLKNECCTWLIEFSLISATRSCSGGANNLPPLQFHHVHGDNVRVSSDGAIARRVESFCRGVAFTSRPIKVQEKVSAFTIISGSHLIRGYLKRKNFKPHTNYCAKFHVKIFEERKKS